MICRVSVYFESLVCSVFGLVLGEKWPIMSCCSPRNLVARTKESGRHGVEIRFVLDRDSADPLTQPCPAFANLRSAMYLFFSRPLQQSIYSVWALFFLFVARCVC